MAIAMRGLRLKPTYEDLVSVANSDELENVEFPNRDVSFLRDGFVFITIGWRRHASYGAAATKADERSISRPCGKIISK